jgi:hypothetical protein
MLHARGSRQPRQFERRRQILGGRLLAVNMLAGGDRLANAGGAHGGGLGVEIDCIVGVGQTLREVGAPALDSVGLCQGAQAALVAPDQHRVGVERVAIGERDAALAADCNDRADQMLVSAHPPGHAIHDNADRLLGHRCAPLGYAPALR